MYIYIYIYRVNLYSIPGRVIPKTLKMVLDTSLLNTHQYKVRIEGKVEQSRKRNNGVVAIEKGAFWSPSTTVHQLYFTIHIYIYMGYHVHFMALGHPILFSTFQ